MKKIIVSGLLSAALVVSALAQDMMKKSLYDRLGGQPAIEAVVKDFAGRVLADARINKKFAKSDANRLVKNLTDFVCSATGGPCKYMGFDMKKAHTNMGVTQGEFNALVEDLVQTLDHFKVPAAEKNELLGALGPLAAQMVENKSTATGTDLPAAFKPAPPLDGGMMKDKGMDGGMMKKSLYDRLGGQPAIEAVVKDFAGRVLADARVNKKFARSNADRLVKNLTDFVCSATGGPCKYMGFDMKKAHKNMSVTQGEFNALVEDLVQTLDKFNVPKAERDELLGALGPMAKEIVEKKGNNSTGTDLPKKFKPAPPQK
jgi:hemoglobin